MVEITVVSSPSLMVMGDGSLLNEMKQLQSLHILCDAPESTNHVGDDAANDVRLA